jgi:uncharacterized protein (TIGR03000 family)
VQDNLARLTVRVPPDAKVWFDDEPTSQQGPVRNFDSPPIDPGQEYTYDIRAQWRQGDREVERTKHVVVEAGKDITVDFTNPPTE